MSYKGMKPMHAACYVAIAVAYLIAVIAYGVLAYGALREGGHAPPEATAVPCAHVARDQEPLRLMKNKEGANAVGPGLSGSADALTAATRDE